MERLKVSKASGWLRQEDPLSHFLITIVADVLSRMMIRAKESSLWVGFFVRWGRTIVPHF